MNLLNLIFALVIFTGSYIHYKSLFNPVGIFSAEWLVIVFLYNLKLSYLLPDLSMFTYAAVYLGVISFIFGSTFFTRGSYKLDEQQVNSGMSRRIKLLIYFLLLVICVIEILIIIPPFLAENKQGTYLYQRGLIFFHMAVGLLPVSYILIFIDSRFKKVEKFVLFFPPFVITSLWMQRGMLLVFLIALIVIYYRRRSPIRFISNFILLFICILLVIHFIGSVRSVSGFGGYTYISTVSQMKVDMPPSLVWTYIYPTTSLANFDRVMKNKNIEYRYGVDLLLPFLTIFQADYLLDIELNYENIRIGDYEVISGFNTPTYLYWCYKNFSYLGLFFIPFLMGVVSQIFYNQYVDGKPGGLAIYSLLLAYIFVSFHDFLLWNSLVVFSIVLIIISNKKIN